MSYFPFAGAETDPLAQQIQAGTQAAQTGFDFFKDTLLPMFNAGQAKPSPQPIPQPQPQVIIQPPTQAGISPTVLAIGGIAIVGLLAVLTLRGGK